MVKKQFDQTQTVVEMHSHYNKFIPTKSEHNGAYEYWIKLNQPFIRDQFYEVVNGLSKGALVYQRDIDLSRIDTGHTAIISQAAVDTWLMSVKKIVETKPDQYTPDELQQFKIVYEQVTALSNIVKHQGIYLRHRSEVRQIFKATLRLCGGFAYSGLIWTIAINFSNWMSQGLFNSVNVIVRDDWVRTLLAALVLIGVAWDILGVIPKMFRTLFSWVYVDDDQFKTMLKRYRAWKYARKVPQSFSLEDGQIKSNAAKKE